MLPDRFVRIRYYGLLANRHREQALALCRKAIPGAPVRPMLTKPNWQSLLQSLTGLDPRKCEVCGQCALLLIGELAPAQTPRGSPVMILLPIVQLQCLSAQPWRQVLVYLADSLRYNPFTKSRFRSQKHAVDPFAGRSSESLAAVVEACVKAGRVSRDGLRRIESP